LSVRAHSVETPVVFGSDQSLIGSFCQPGEGGGNDRPTILFLSPGIVQRAGPNRIYVRLARALAAEGYSSLRFDLSGVGDSVLPRGAAVMSVHDRVKLDIEDAIDYLRSRGARSVVLLGLCSGADHALRTMARTESVVGSVLLDLNTHRTTGFYLRHYARSVFSIQSWLNKLSGQHSLFGGIHPRPLGGSGDLQRNDGADPNALGVAGKSSLSLEMMRDHLLRIVGRRGKLLCIFTAGLSDQYNYRKQFLDLFPNLDFRGCLQLEYFHDSDHTFSFEALRERLTRMIVGWVTKSFPGTVLAPPTESEPTLPEGTHIQMEGPSP
jgi:pimeloyl-ACP methyl ester carboxylesterase